MANTKVKAEQLEAAQTNITSVGTLSALTISGDLTVDTSTLKVDSSNNRVGIGDTTPQALLDVGGGYGSNTTVATFAHATDAYIEIENMTTQNGAGIILTNAGTKKWTIQKDTSAHSLHIQDTSGDVMKFLQGGHVLIGSDSGDAFNADSMLRLQRTGDRVFIQIKTDTDQDSGILFGTTSDDVHHQILHDVSEDKLIFKAQSAETMVLDAGSHVGIKTSTEADGTAMTSPLTISGANDGGNIIEAHRTANSKIQLYMSTGGVSYLDVSGTTPQLKIRTSGTDRVNIHESNGYVGLIGSSDVRLTLSSEGTEGDNSANWVRGNSAGLSFNAKTSGKHMWEINGTEVMRITDDGQVCINATTAHSSSTKLHIEGGTSSQSTPIVYIADRDGSVEGNSTILELAFDNDNSFSSANYVLFTDEGGTQGEIKGTGDGTVDYDTSSDERLKDNIRDTGSKWDMINAIKVRDFEWKRSGNTNTAFIAQELYSVYPEAASKGGEDPKEDPWMVNYSRVTPILTKALQEAMKRIETLEAEVKTLKGG